MTTAHLNLSPPIADGHGLYLTAVREDAESAKAFADVIMARLEADPRTAGLYTYVVFSGDGGPGFVWLRHPG